MKLFKVIGLLSLSVFLAWQSVVLIDSLFTMPDQSIAIDVVLSIILNLFVTGTFAFLGFALPSYRLLPDSYYRFQRPTMLKRIYHYFKVNWFRRFLLATFWKNRAQQKRFFDGTRKGLDQLINESKSAEFGHLFPFLIIATTCILLIFKGHFVLAGIAMKINTVFNLYPILLQRYHRMRVSRLKYRFNR